MKIVVWGIPVPSSRVKVLYAGILRISNFIKNWKINYFFRNHLRRPYSELYKWKAWGWSAVNLLSRVRLCNPMENPMEPVTLLRPWDFLGKSTGVGYHFLLQRIFPTQGSNLGLPHCRQMLYHLSHQGSHKNERHKGNSKQKEEITARKKNTPLATTNKKEKKWQE